MQTQRDMFGPDVRIGSVDTMIKELNGEHPDLSRKAIRYAVITKFAHWELFLDMCYNLTKYTQQSRCDFGEAVTQAFINAIENPDDTQCSRDLPDLETICRASRKVLAADAEKEKHFADGQTNYI